ncbi:MAG TPA: suppressor of fused domain protein [Saprospiraceae bacterium]|nr:suppressor of fused domain protein [Saprospiraceae bacterium]
MIKNKAIAHYIAKITGTQPTVLRFQTDEKAFIDIVSVTEHGDDKLNVHSTIGLSARKTNEENRDIELMLVAEKKYDLAPNILASGALKAMLEGWQTVTGAIYAHIFSAYYPNVEVKHGLLIPPYLWKDTLKTLDLGDRMVQWKMIVPITDQEANYLRNNAPSSLLPLFVEKDINLFDLGRESVV